LVVIPPEKIKEVDWREGTELKANVKEDKIILKTK
jgi:antitoxin component of MazEF toxin-antitoxin module